MREKTEAIKLGSRFFDESGIRKHLKSVQLGLWADLRFAAIERGKRLSGWGYWLNLEFEGEQAIRVWLASGVKNLRILGRVLRLIRSVNGKARLCDDCIELLRILEMDSSNPVKLADANEEQILAAAKLYLSALEFPKAMRACKRLHKAADETQLEARRIEIRALLILKRFGAAWRKLKVVRKRFPCEEAALVDYTFATLFAGKQSAERFALDLLERRVNGSVGIGIKLAYIYFERKAYKEALSILNVLGDWPHLKTDDEIQEIANLRHEIANTVEYDENVSGFLFKKSLFSRLPTLICLIVLGFWFALPAIKQTPEIYREISETIRLETWGSRAKQVVIKSTIQTSQFGLTRIYYDFATGFAENEEGRIVPAAWTRGSSLVTTKHAQRILSDPENQYVNYDPNHVYKNVMGPVTPWRLALIYTPRVLNAKVEFGALFLVLLLILSPFVALFGSMSKSMYLNIANAFGPKPKQLEV